MNDHSHFLQYGAMEGSLVMNKNIFHKMQDPLYKVKCV